MQQVARDDLWWELVSKFIFEDFVDIKRITRQRIALHAPPARCVSIYRRGNCWLLDRYGMEFAVCPPPITCEDQNMHTLLFLYIHHRQEVVELDEKIRELTLLLLYLTSWKEDELPEEMRRSWKGYPFDVLNELTDEDFIRGSIRSKSVYLTEAGIKEAEALVKKYQ